MDPLLHFEIYATDPDQLQKFYTDVFGWEFKKWEGPMNYWLITAKGEGGLGVDGGMMKREGAAPTTDEQFAGYMCTMGVEDIDATVEKITAAGGKITRPKMAIPGIGWHVYATDPDGNYFGAMQSDMEAK
jgi:uncharacterized protein